MKRVSIGIDLGTTYSSLSYIDSDTNSDYNSKILLYREHNSTCIPSTFTIINEDNFYELLFGEDSKKENDIQTFYEFKRFIGRTFKEIQEYDRKGMLWTFFVGDTADEMISLSVEDPKNKSNLLSFSPTEVTAIFLKKLISNFKQGQTNCEIENAVVTVPVYATSFQRMCTLRACKLAGLDNVELINETTASIIQYKQYLQNCCKSRLPVGTNVIIIDFGGGTLDISVCKIVNDEQNDNMIKVLSHHGDNNLGGKNFDNVLKEILREKCLKNQEFPNFDSYFLEKGSDTKSVQTKKRKRRLKLMNYIEEKKKTLTTQNSIKIPLDKIFGEEYDDVAINIKQDEFSDRCEKELIPRFKEIVEEAIKQSGICIKDIDIVLPIGGTCKVPTVFKAMTEIFGGIRKFPKQSFDTETSVSQGAAYHAFRLSKDKGNKDVKEIVPFSIGTDLVGKRVAYFVRKGDCFNDDGYIKVSRSFIPAADNQTIVSYELLVGESERSDGPGMKSLQYMNVNVPPNTKKEDFSMLCTMSVYRDMTVDVIVESKGRILNTMLKVELDLKKEEEDMPKMQETVSKFVKQ